MRNLEMNFAICGLLLLWAMPVSGEDRNPSADKVTWEDLAACKLPNELTVLGGRGAPLTTRRGGSVFSFATKTFSAEPDLDEKEFSVEKVLALLKGDICYGVPEGGFFMVTSGRITDLGRRYLHEFDGAELARPGIVKTRQDGHEFPGLLTGIRERIGHCFLLETTDGKSVLLRLVSEDKQRNVARVQWVFQPDGSRKFSIPKPRVVTEAAAPRGPGGGPPVAAPIIAALDMRDFAKAIAAHKENRRKLVDLSTAFIAAEPADAQLYNRHQACLLLGELRAAEAAPTLAPRIDDNLALVSFRVTVQNSYRCVQALVDIGIPGAQAALKQMATDAASAPPKDGDPRHWGTKLERRRDLLALVVLKVYGEKLAKILLQDKIAESDGAKVKEAYQKALEAFPRIKNWLPDEKNPTARPATAMPAK